MDEHLRHQRDAALGQLEALIRRGRAIRNTPFDAAQGAPSASRGAPVADAIRAWQRDCAAAVSHLSGGSKAHWLSRAYSSALLVRSPDGGVVVEADAADIVDRILDVLAQGATSLSRMDDLPASNGAARRPRRFEFVHHAELRPVLEQALDESRDALEHGDCGLALILSCGIIDALLTDALDHARSRDHNGSASAWHQSTASDGETSPTPGGEGGSFATRIAAAEQAGLIRGGCARLPPVARTYRDLTDEQGELRAEAAVSEREARLAGQVLRVVMRDLDPGR